MNLIDLINRKDKRLSIKGGWRQAKARRNLSIWRVVEFDNGSELTIGGVDKVYRLATLPDQIGWFVRLRRVAKWSFDLFPRGRCEVSTRHRGSRGTTAGIRFGRSAVPVPMPWDKSKGLPGNAELQLSFIAPKGYVVELLVHKALNRKVLIKRAVGKGIEIGPGPRPQILASGATSVCYLEEMPIEKWAQLYDPTGKYGTPKADFSKYVIGTADNLPAEDGSLDFIFSSHVFEHLANPLGHLVRWRDKLSAGGVILAVIPDMHSTKDSVGRPSEIGEIKAEFDAGIWRPVEAHYERYFALRGKPQLASEMMEKDSSIHVHFYDKDSLKDLLDLAVREYGFSSYEIIHADNHKDFYFSIWK
ncbi:methyltransferase domain-containing protein [Neorhizobium sp. P12A]|uniref:class I SAM-dependent methyltransferase n=1 Tax=Neorhizobium sp. P12A TaxID=2268027 RepID=UPI00165E6E4F|nr:methyltransferase domain-containing protein [Neorhizobium sp. P12A]